MRSTNPVLRRALLALAAPFALVATSGAATIAYWDFEDGSINQPFTDVDGGAANGSGGSADTVSGTLMRGWDNFYGPSFTHLSSDFSGLAMSNADNHQDGYVFEGPLMNWAPQQWTIETTVYLEEIAGWETLIGRDGSSQSEPESDFYLANNGIDDRFRINVDTVGGQRWILDGDYEVKTNTWYALAAINTGETLELWLDDSTGYQMIGSLDITAQSVADNGMPASAANWTFGRGWYNGAFVDHIDGRMDNIRFSDVALASGDLIPLVIPEPASLGLLAVAGLVGLARRK